MNIILFSDKPNFRSLMKLSNRVVIIPNEYLRLSFFRNPEYFPLSEHLNTSISSLTDFSLLFPGISFIRSMVDELNQKWGFYGQKNVPCPNLSDVYEFSLKKKLRLYSEKQKYKERAEDRLDSILKNTGKIFRCHFGMNLKYLLRQNTIIEIYGLFPFVKRLIISAFLQYLYFSKLTDKSNYWKTPICVIIDEGQEIFRRNLEERELLPFIDKFISVAREQNIGVITGTQIYSDLSLNVRMNSSTKIGCGFEDKQDQQSFCRSIGISDAEQFKYISQNLRPGVALLSTFKYPNPFILNIPYIDLDSFVSDKKVLERLNNNIEYIYHPDEQESVRFDILNAIGVSTGAKLLNSPTEKKPVHQKSIKESKKDEIKNRYLKPLILMLSKEHPFIPQTDLFKEAGITSGSMQIKYKNYYVTNSIAIIHEFQRKRGKIHFLEITKVGYNIIGTTPLTFSGKGGYPHSAGSKHAESWGVKEGYKVLKEWLLSNGKAVDLFLSKESTNIFIEIAITKIESVDNIIEDFTSNLVPDKLIIACKDSKIKKAQEKLISSDERLSAYRSKIDICYAGDFVQLNSRNKRKRNNV